MKKIYLHLLRCFVVLSLLALLFTGNVQSQSLIYGTANGHLVSFDYLSGAYNTIPTTTYFPNPNTSFGCAMDPYNGRYFYDAAPLSNGGVIKYIDLNTYAVAQTCYFEYKNWIEYNSLNNSILFAALDGDFYSYSLGNSVLTHLSTLPASNAIIYGETRVYNPVNNTLFFQRYSDSTWYDIIDGFTGELLHSHVSHAGVIESAVVDYQTGQYYGVRHDTIVKFDPLTEIVTPVIALPLPLVHLNNQMAVYDQDSSKFIIPTYKNSNNKAYYMVADVKKPHIDKVIEQPDMNVNWQRIYSKPNTLLARISDTLYCPKGVTYRWVRGNDTIPGAATSAYKPTQSGLYKAVVHYPGYPSESKYFNFAMTNTGETAAPGEIRLFPNPAGDVIYYDLSDKGKAGNGACHIEITDAFGRTLFSADRNDAAGRGSVNLSTLPAGYYILHITSRKLTVAKGFLHF
ncbi:MAG: T9SS type A sorting domain-containing protein [Bacteroidota bacterium]